ncbi:MAG: PAS-domain containing protein [Alphaproteobacteria bacterium]|nr:PAS-domain containing protein [Alphaproteobacteria bacterium]
MSQLLLTNAPYIAVLAILGGLFLAVGYQFGLGMPTMVILGFGMITLLLSGMVILLNKRLVLRDKDGRQARFAAERWQTMVASTPGGYCLFTPQGLLREAVRMAPLLGLEKVSHIEDIVGVLKDPADFLAAFRHLQMTGTSFSQRVDITSNAEQQPRCLQVQGRRIRIGREGPLLDIMWFVEIPAVPVVDKHEPQAGPADYLDMLPVPVWLRGHGLDLIHGNKGYCQAVDTTPALLVEHQVELASAATGGGSGKVLAGNAIAAAGAQQERRHVIVSGKRRLLEITEIPAPTDLAFMGQTVTTFGFAIDVTTEEEKDGELQRHLSAQHEVLENMGSAIAIFGANMRLEFYNQAYLRLWEFSEPFLDGKPTMGEILEDLRERRRIAEQPDFQRFKKEKLAVFTSQTEPQEDLDHLPDGTTLRVVSAPHPMGGLIFVHEDVTDKLAMESSYNTLIAVQRETLDNLAEGIAVFGSDGKLQLHNPAFARIWRLSPVFLETAPHVSDLLENMKPLFNFGSNWAVFKSEMVAYILDRNPRRGRIERADTSIIEYNTVPLPDGAVLNSYLDITDSLKVEQALRASNAALATADRLKSEFVANVSYQLRTPLSTISGFADILTNQYFGTLNERQLEYTRTISDASHKLLLLINDVLDLATIEAGRMTLNRRSVDVTRLLASARTMTAEWARQQELDVTINCPGDIGYFDVDENRMKQVLFNLVGNAIKYTPKGGQITLTAARDEDWVTLTVADTGIGIPEADRQRIFGKFERSNASARQAGVGLGLSLVKNFIELHGGRVELVSEINKGTSITCFIPNNPPDNGHTLS